MIQFNILSEPKQRFSVLLNRRRVTFDLWYNVTNDRWSFDLSIDNDPVLHGRRVVTGVDLLAPFSLGIGLIIAWSDSGALPGRDALPQGTIRLYSATQEEADAAVAA